ncbi:MAG: hypothetical protein IPO90_12305 [Flavobacteriales bacterium]|nr:hypothetical protein [Flavobacteriales bacterium]
MRVALFHGLLTATVAALVSILYMNVYSEALAVDFSAVVNVVGIIAACLIGGLLPSLGFYFFSDRVSTRTDLWFNAIFTFLTFASCVPVFGLQLPLTVKAPELFIGMVIPMHFFPLLFWLVSRPLFAYPEG